MDFSQVTITNFGLVARSHEDGPYLKSKTRRGAALPSDLRKRSALPSILSSNSGSARKKGRSPEFFKRPSRKARGLPHIRRHSRVWMTLRQTCSPHFQAGP